MLHVKHVRCKTKHVKHVTCKIFRITHGIFENLNSLGVPSNSIETMSIEARDPVQMAIQRHMGIDNDNRSQTQQGIAVIIGGGPFAGKTLIARQVCLNLRKNIS